MSQRRRFFLRAGTLALALGAAISIVGCSPSGGSGGDAGVLPPVIVDINEIEGTTVEVARGNVIDLTGDDDTFLEWSGKVADEKIAEFTPGKDDGSAQFNPGVTGLSTGQTEVTLDNAASGETVTFTVEVTDAAN
jgi:hypothetical protein